MFYDFISTIGKIAAARKISSKKFSNSTIFSSSKFNNKN